MKGSSNPDAQSLFDQLEARGIGVEQYANIKAIVNFGLPQFQVFFYRRFGPRTISSVLEQVDLWNRFLEKQSLFSGDERDGIGKLISGAEWFAWSALLASNLPQIGPWTVSCVFLPTRIHSKHGPQYLYPSLEVRAVHRENREERRAVIPGKEYHNPARFPGAWRKAFEQLGISHLLEKGIVHKGVASRRPAQAWPAFTKQIIPALYEYLHPYYLKPGHHSTKRDELEMRPALFPKELLEHMLAILRVEHPDTFRKATAGQLKAVIQRHLDRRSGSTNSTK
jgi:hypothetical protein